MFFRFHDLLWEVILGLSLHIQAWKLLILRNLQLRTFVEPWLHFKTRNRVCIKKSKHHFLHHQTLEVVFDDHIKHFKVVKILYFACVFSSPLSMFEMSQPVDRLSVWEKKQRGKGRESGKVGGGGGGFFLLPSSTLDQRMCWIFIAVRWCQQRREGFWKLLSLKTLSFKSAINHLNSKRDQHRFSPKNVSTLTKEQVKWELIKWWPKGNGFDL